MVRSAGAGIALASALVVGCSGGSGGGMLPQPQTTTLLDVQAQVFGPHCALSGCHTGATPPKGLELATVQTSAANLVGVPSVEQPAVQRIAPFDVANSYLYRKVTGAPGISGDRMPLNNTPLSAADLALIRAWIEQGAL